MNGAALVNRLDRYILTQLLGPFGFFALVLTGVIWLTQALRLLDWVIANNQSALVFLEFSSFTLPGVLATVLPLAAFGATLFALNRLYSESELVVFLAAGRSALSLARPALMFGAFAAMMMCALTLYLSPLSARQLAERKNSIRTEVVNAFVSEGQFMHPAAGVTIFVRDMSRQGEMQGIFLHDERDPAQAITYTAQKALLLNDVGKPRLVMIDGIAQTITDKGKKLTSVRFGQLAYDLSGFAAEQGGRTLAPREYFIARLLRPDAGMLESQRYMRGDYVAEGHSQLATPLLALIGPALALAAILGGSFRRSGIGLRLFLATLAMALIQLASVVVKSLVTANPELALVSYLPPLVAAIAALVLLLRSDGMPALTRIRRRAAPA